MTFSVVARDDTAGLLGVAVSSCVLAVGARVPLAVPGTGTVAVQAGGWLQWRQVAAAVLSDGGGAADAVAAVRALDAEGASQGAVVGRTGTAVAWTGAGCEPAAGHRTSAWATGTVAAQANTMAEPASWPAMHDAYRSAVDTGKALPEALVAALRAGQDAGGDVRGRQSAALLVVPLHDTAPPSGGADDPTVDLRVDDARDPVGELGRLLAVHRAHRLLVASGEAAGEDRLALLRSAAEAAPDDVLAPPAAGIALALAGRLDEGLDLLRGARVTAPDAVRWARHRARLALADDGTREAAGRLLAALDQLDARDGPVGPDPSGPDRGQRNVS